MRTPAVDDLGRPETHDAEEEEEDVINGTKRNELRSFDWCEIILSAVFAVFVRPPDMFYDDVTSHAAGE